MNRPARAVSAVAGLAGVATSICSGLLTAAPAAAVPSTVEANLIEDVNNDWGQDTDAVEAEIAAAVDADPTVRAARARYDRALAVYSSVKRAVHTAAQERRRAHASASRADDRRTARALAAARARVRPAASEVVAAQLAMVEAVKTAEARARSLHYVQAPAVPLPAQPAGVVTEDGSGQVRLHWEPVDAASQYRVYRDGTQVGATVDPSYLDTGLADGSAYGYTVRAVNAAGWSPLSEEVVGHPSAAAPGVPTGLVAVPGDGAVTLSWTATPGATGYRVLRNGSPVGTPSGPAFTDTGLTDGVSYAYTVQAVNGLAASAPASAVAATPVATAPAAPTGLSATAGDTRVDLSWSASPTATAYQVYRDGAPVGTTTATTSFADTGLTNGVTHAYRVTATRLNSPASAASATVSATPVPPPLAAPSGVTVTPGDGQVSLTWNAVAGADSYRVYRDATLAGSPVGTSFTDTGRTNGTSYTYTVVAVSVLSTSPASTAVTATPMAAAPGAPTGLAGQAGDTAATLTWTAVSGATSYRVYRGGVLRTTVTGTTYTDTGLTNGTAYAYDVTAVKSGVESAGSATVTVTPVAVVPAVPTGVAGTAGNGQVAVSWAASAHAQSYRVYRSGTLVGSPTATSFTDTGLTNGTSYSYTVVAVNGTATSAASAPVTATPMAPAPAAPTGLTATAGNSQVALAWTAPPTATSYAVYRGGVLVGSPTATSFTDTGLTNGTSYSYYVRALTATTPSAPSATVSATPVAPGVSGTFTGAIASIAQGHGTLQVVVVLTNGQITSATGTLLTNDGSETRTINASAIPQYNAKAVAANSAAITKVSGASLTWTAYKTSLQSALTQAGL